MARENALIVIFERKAMSDASGATEHGPAMQPLLSYGDARMLKPREWPNYIKLFSLTSQHIPELIKLATDRRHNFAEDDPAMWGPVHAWRALGQLRAEKAIEPLIGLLHYIDQDGDDWINEEIPPVLGMIGPSAIEPLRTYISSRENPKYARIVAGESLRMIPDYFPEQRERIINILSEQLSRGTNDEREINGFIVGELLDLNAVEKVQVIKAAYDRKCVDYKICGNWKEVQQELGLLPKEKRVNMWKDEMLARSIDSVFGPRRGEDQSDPFGR
jgi:hypothetical protein